MSHLEQTLALQLDASGIEYEREYRFHASRKWRADFFIRPNLLVECEGGLWIRGRHNRGAGMLKDMDKYNAAAELGYIVCRYGKEHINDGRAIAQIERVIGHDPVDGMRRAGGV